MMPYAGLNKRVNEVFDGFLRYYPSYQEFRQEILEVTEKHIFLRLAAMSEDALNGYFFGHQLHADITVEITKQAMRLKEFIIPVKSVVPRESLQSPQSSHPSHPSHTPHSLHTPQSRQYSPCSPTSKTSFAKRSARNAYEKEGNVIFLPFKGCSLPL
ncbi:MAG: hypothetical protein ACRKFN_09500 [Desulfitobacterium sp.]